MFEGALDKIIGVLAYYVMIFDPLRLRTTAGKAIVLAREVIWNNVQRFRTVVAYAIAKPMGEFMRKYAWFLGTITGFWVFLRVTTTGSFDPEKTFFSAKAIWPAEAQVLTIGIVVGSAVWAIRLIRISAEQQILNGKKNILGWVDDTGEDVSEDTPDAIPIHAPDDLPLEVSFFRSGADLTKWTWVMGIAMLCDSMAAQNKWILLPVTVLLCGGLVVVKTVVAIGSWMFRKGIKMLETGGEIALQPLAALPGLELDKLNQQLFKGGHLNIFDEDEDADKVDKTVAYVIQIMLPFLIICFLVDADQLYCLITGAVLGITVLAGLAFSADGHKASVDLVVERRRKFLRILFMIAPWIAIVTVGGAALYNKLVPSDVQSGVTTQKVGATSWLTCALQGGQVIREYSFFATMAFLILGIAIFSVTWDSMEKISSRYVKAVAVAIASVLPLYFFLSLLVYSGVWDGRLASGSSSGACTQHKSEPVSSSAAVTPAPTQISPSTSQGATRPSVQTQPAETAESPPPRQKRNASPGVLARQKRRDELLRASRDAVGRL
jgi:hypothetical protein